MATSRELATPREVFFSVMSDEWKISNTALADIILSPVSTDGSEQSPREKAKSRSTRSRYVVHVKPGDGIYGWLPRSFDAVVPALMARCKRKGSNQQIIDFFSGPAEHDMSTSLKEYKLDAALYENAVRDILVSEQINEADRAEALVRLFTVCGCLGNPQKAVQDALETIRKNTGATLKTQLPSKAGLAGAEQQPMKQDLGLCRFKNGMLLSNPYRLSRNSEGTEIGSRSMTDHSINDVGEGVSRRHLRIFCDQAGLWWAQGLGSVGGTLLISGDDQSETVVEAPRAERSSDSSNPVRILPGDRLILAGTTEFVVVVLAEQ